MHGRTVRCGGLEPHRGRTGNNWTIKKDTFNGGVNIFRLARMDCAPANPANFARIGGGAGNSAGRRAAVRPFPSLCPRAFG